MSERGIGVRSILVRWDRYSPKFGPGQANSDFQIFQIFALSCCHSLGRHGPVFRARYSISCSSKKRTKAREKTINICSEIMSSTFIGNKQKKYTYILISVSLKQAQKWPGTKSCITQLQTLDITQDFALAHLPELSMISCGCSGLRSWRASQKETQHVSEPNTNRLLLHPLVN